jgi:hypothetical protein
MAPYLQETVFRRPQPIFKYHISTDSPIGEGEFEDEGEDSGGVWLLDYESDSDWHGAPAVSTSALSEYQVQLQTHTAMDTDLPRDAATSCEGQEVPAPAMDAVYYQCQSARMLSYKDTWRWRPTSLPARPRKPSRLAKKQ